MEPFDLIVIPDILQGASMRIERPWSLKKMGELLKLSYQLTEHPILKRWWIYDPINFFDISDFTIERFKHFNRTIIERTIMQSEHFSQIKADYGVLTMRSLGIELTIIDLESFLLSANKLYNSTELELQNTGPELQYFRLTQSGVITAAINYFMEVCNNLIELTFKHFISEKLTKIILDEEKVKYILRQKTDLLLQQEQFEEKTFKNIISVLDIELGYHKKIKEYSEIPSELKEIITQFFTEKDARISNNKLLGLLIEEKIEEFCLGLSELVMELFSYHDVGAQEPEKVYHVFLLGVLNSFKEFYHLESNKESGIGRFDILLLPDTLEYKGVIIEVKRITTNRKEKINDLLEEALSQIIDNNYAIKLKLAGHKEYIALAALFNGKKLYLKFAINKTTNSL